MTREESFDEAFSDAEMLAFAHGAGFVIYSHGSNLFHATAVSPASSRPASGIVYIGEIRRKSLQ